MGQILWRPHLGGTECCDVLVVILSSKSNSNCCSLCLLIIQTTSEYWKSFNWSCSEKTRPNRWIPVGHDWDQKPENCDFPAHHENCEEEQQRHYSSTRLRISFIWEWGGLRVAWYISQQWLNWESAIWPAICYHISHDKNANPASSPLEIRSDADLFLKSSVTFDAGFLEGRK